jgi:hypothetical protein
MKLGRSIHWMIWVIWVSAILTIGVASAVGDDVSVVTTTTAQTDSKASLSLEAPDWQTVLDRLFGTPDSGLLDGTRSFEFRAEDVTLTAAQSAEFFTSTASPVNLATLVETTQTLHGTVRLEGTIDGQSFELKIAGRELKLEGLVLTSDQLQELVTELRAAGLHEMKIQALVDGQMTVLKAERNHEKIEVLGSKRDKHEVVFTERGKRERPEKIEIAREKPERPERPARFERPEKPEHVGLGKR